MFERHGPWLVRKSLGKGGQGEVFLVRKLPSEQLTNLQQHFGRLIKRGLTEEEWLTGGEFLEHLLEAFEAFSSGEIGALKVLLTSEEAKNSETARDRAKQEIEVLGQFQHPNLIRLLDHDPERQWLVMEYHERGTLWDQQKLFVGDVRKALSAFRPVVDAVAELHRRDCVHRDIKPANILLANDGRLVLGDLGLVFDSRADDRRLTQTGEVVGSWEWMPTWAQGEYIDNPSPQFDVFCLGKVFWALLSGKRYLRLHHFPVQKYNLEVQFPDDPAMKLVNEFLATCLVDNESDCLRNATELLEKLEALDDSLDVLPPGDHDSSYVLEDLSAILTSRPFRLYFKPPDGSKRISFRDDGAVIEGQNQNEHTWRIRDAHLELLQADGQVHSRFAFDRRTGVLAHTNDSDTLSLRDQYIAPEV